MYFPLPSPSTPLDVAQRRQQRPTASARVLALLEDGHEACVDGILASKTHGHSCLFGMPSSLNLLDVVYCACAAWLCIRSKFTKPSILHDGAWAPQARCLAEERHSLRSSA